MENQLPWNEILKQEREKRLWSQEELAEKVGADERQVRAWENGEHFPSLDYRRALCQVYGKKPEELGLVGRQTKNKKEKASTPNEVSEALQSDVSSLETMQSKITPSIPVSSPPSSSLDGTRPSRGRRRVWLVTLGILLALVLFFSLYTLLASGILGIQKQGQVKASDCEESTTGVTLYIDSHYRGHCHTFPPGDYDLSDSGLSGNVSSLKDPNGAYHITLIDKSNRPGYFDADQPQLPADWNNQAQSLRVEKHRPTTCNPGSDGIIAYIDNNYQAGCFFITKDIPDLTVYNFEQVISSIRFIGTYKNTKHLVIYRQPNYRDECGRYWQDQSDLLKCADQAVSVRVLPFTPPTPIPTRPGTTYSGNIAPQATLSPAGSSAAIDGSLTTEWIGGHMAELDLSWPSPVIIHRVVVWDRSQSTSDNNQINMLKLVFSDKTSTIDIDMISGGPRCADITFIDKVVSWVHIVPTDVSGNNGYREVEVWATTGPQYSNNNCVNKVNVSS